MNWLHNLDLLIPVPVLRLYARIRHPVDSWRLWRKWRNRPSVGDMVEDCRGLILAVTGIGESEDDLTLSDGSSVSWMHCCDRPR